MELPKLGDRCQLKECNQLDFLPLPCAHCLATFCKDHVNPDSHSCPSAPNTVLTDDQITEQAALLHLKTYTCSFDMCSERGPMELLCCVCSKHFCVGHRHHGCIDPKKEQRMARREKFEAPKRQFQAAKDKVDKMLDATIEKNRALSGSKLATANKVQLMRLKQRATGRKNIPVSVRAYFLVHWKICDSQTTETKAVFVSKDWSMGRVTDMVAEQCKLANGNNNPNSPKLKLFHMDGRVLSDDLAVTLHSVMSENVLIDGASITIDYSPL